MADGGVRAARIGVAAAFTTHAVVSGTWAPRLPAIKDSLELSDGQLGTALVGLALGLVVGTRLAGAPVDRFGSRPVMRAGFPVLGAALVLPALAGSAAVLFVALFALGVVSGLLDVAMNANGIELERRIDRPLLSGLHGLWSVGLGIGAGLSVVAAALDVGTPAHFAAVGLAVALISLWSMRGLLSTHAAGQTIDKADADRKPVGWTLGLAVLGAVTFASFAGEGSASDWSAVYLDQELSAAPGTAAAGFAAFATAMALARFAADPLRARLGPVLLVRCGALLGATGLLLALVVDDPVPAIAGFALMGAGLAPIVPIAFSAAGGLDPAATGTLVGRVATVGYVGSVAGPIMIGWLAEATSLRLALGLIVLLALFAAAAAGSTAPSRASSVEAV